MIKIIKHFDIYAPYFIVRNRLTGIEEVQRPPICCGFQIFVSENPEYMEVYNPSPRIINLKQKPQ